MSAQSGGALPFRFFRARYIVHHNDAAELGRLGLDDGHQRALRESAVPPMRPPSSPNANTWARHPTNNRARLRCAEALLGTGMHEHQANATRRARDIMVLVRSAIVNVKIPPKETSGR